MDGWGWRRSISSSQPLLWRKDWSHRRRREEGELFKVIWYVASMPRTPGRSRFKKEEQQEKDEKRRKKWRAIYFEELFIMCCERGQTRADPHRKWGNGRRERIELSSPRGEGEERTLPLPARPQKIQLIDE